MKTILTLLLAATLAQDLPKKRNLIEEYRKANFGDKGSWPALNDVYRDRIALEFDIIRSGRVEPLREALGDSNRCVRSFAAQALGILGDRASVAAIAKMLEDPDADTMVGNAAVQALGWLKGGREAVQSAKDKSRANRRLVDIAEGQIQDSVDHAAKVREAYQLGIKREDIGSAKVGKPAPGFTAVDTQGRSFTLADAVKKYRVVILVFVSADW